MNIKHRFIITIPDNSGGSNIVCATKVSNIGSKPEKENNKYKTGCRFAPELQVSQIYKSGPVNIEIPVDNMIGSGSKVLREMFRATESGVEDKRDIDIDVLRADGSIFRTYVLIGAYCEVWEQDDLEARSNDYLLERLTIACERIDIYDPTVVGSKGVSWNSSYTVRTVGLGGRGVLI